MAVHAAEYRRFPFTGMVHEINHGQQREHADDEARAKGRARRAGGELIWTAGRGWLHINHFQRRMYRKTRADAAGISVDGAVTPVDDAPELEA